MHVWTSDLKSIIVISQHASHKPVVSMFLVYICMQQYLLIFAVSFAFLLSCSGCFGGNPY